MFLNRRIRAVLFDFDGTLYQQTLLRALMLSELCALPFARCSFGSATKVLRVLDTFRRVREELRGISSETEPLVRVQYLTTAQRLNIDVDFIKAVVEEWIHRRPLKYLRFCRRRGLGRFSEFLREQKIQVGLFSDYPAEEKLAALDIFRDRLWPILCATDPEINAFKPHPKGFLVACHMWQLPPDEVLYLGDRPEVDAAGAAAAGMPCAIICGHRSRNFDLQFGKCFCVSSFDQLRNVLVSKCQS
jgi:HAD superfamily hydrolase (TIGR01549 family)